MCSHSTYPFLELVVVDSTGDQALRKKIERECARVGAKYAYEHRSGVSVARNTGVQNCAGDIVVFVDDDFIVEKNFLAQLVDGYKGRDVECCTGRMVSYRNDDLGTLFEKYLSFDKGQVELCVSGLDMNLRTFVRAALSKLRKNGRSIPPYSVGFGFGSYRREVFHLVGGFDSNLGRGTPKMGSEELDMYYRILRKGYKIVYKPSAKIWHNHKHSTTKEALVEYAYMSGISVAALARKHFATDPYILALFIGNVFLTLSWVGKALTKSDSTLRELSFAQLRGLLRGIAL